MDRQELFARATDPRQYDAPGLDWPREGVLSAPFAQFCHRALSAALGDLRGRTVLDIGCGTGHLFVLFRRLGARRVVGLEPSARNAALARWSYSDLGVVRGSLARAPLRPVFDVAVAVMSFEHVPDLGAAFAAVFDLLAPGSSLHLVAGDKEFQLTPRWGLDLEAHGLPDGSALVATRYPYGTLHDLVRPVEHFVRAAETAGFAPVLSEPLLPTADLMAADARWRRFAGRPIARRIVAAKGG